MPSVPLPPGWDVDRCPKDESTRPTGSIIRRRPARPPFPRALWSRWIRPGHATVKASRGSTAISDGSPTAKVEARSRTVGIGRRRVVPGSVRGAIDGLMRVPDAAWIASTHVPEFLLGSLAGTSTGTGS
ncbi:hypothetical protein [Actinacidiphila sp. ITFR-21]|uniref:hypothetical protein n=1 Tax=Actinacidiphila sp. ITFR-21 TaxID=3075199 RepID=UPI0028894CB7|nr:hypothetical protein [Streptomyces sp. ITFR-21]WNI15898.1 hypothetical protein RLT57_10445 [Streptomyces sp. ITFR-21]